MDDVRTVKETFEDYYQRIKDDFYNTLCISGINKHDLSPLLIKIIETKLLEDAKRFWEIKISIDNIPKSLEAAIPSLMGEKSNKTKGEDGCS